MVGLNEMALQESPVSQQETFLNLKQFDMYRALLNVIEIGTLNAGLSAQILRVGFDSSLA